MKGPIKDIRIASGEIKQSRTQIINMTESTEKEGAAKKSSPPNTAITSSQVIPQASVPPFNPSQPPPIIPQQGASQPAYIPPSKRQQQQNTGPVHPPSQQGAQSKPLPRSPHRIPLPASPQAGRGIPIQSPQRAVSARVQPNTAGSVSAGGIRAAIDMRDPTLISGAIQGPTNTNASGPSSVPNPTTDQKKGRLGIICFHMRQKWHPFSSLFCQMKRSW